MLGHTAELGGAEIGMVNMARHLPADLRVLLLEDGPLVERVRATGRPVEVCDLNAALGPPRRTAGELRRHARALRELRRAILDRVERHRADVVLLNTLRVTRLVAACALPPRVRGVTMLRDGLGPPHFRRRDAVVDQVAVNTVSSAVVANSAWTRRRLVTRVLRSWCRPSSRPTCSRPRSRPAATRASCGCSCSGGWRTGRAAARPARARRLPDAPAAAGDRRRRGLVRRDRAGGEGAAVRPRAPGAARRCRRGTSTRSSTLIDRHDVLLHTSLLPEPFGQVVVQGMARGRVVVAADRGGPAEVISRARTACSTGWAPGRPHADPGAGRRRTARSWPRSGRTRPRRARRYHPERTAARLRAPSTGWPARRRRAGAIGILGPVRGLPDQLRLLLTGTPPRRIGFSPGPLTDLRRARHALGSALRTRPLRLCLLEHDTSTMYFAEPTAFWINQRSRVCWAGATSRRSGRPRVGVHPGPAHARGPGLARRAAAPGPARRPGAQPARRVRRLPRPDCFPRLAAAGVRVPRTEFGPADVGVTPVVYKAVGEQAARKELCRYDGPRPGFRAAVAHDSRGTDGRYRRYRAFVLGDLVLPEDVIVADHWNASLRHLVTVERNYALTEFERRQLLLINSTLGLDFSCVDYLRERDTGDTGVPRRQRLPDGRGRLAGRHAGGRPRPLARLRQLRPPPPAPARRSLRLAAGRRRHCCGSRRGRMTKVTTSRAVA